MEDGKIERAFTVQPGHVKWLEEMAARYEIEDVSKAMRIVLEYAMREGDEETIFEEVRCHYCG